MQKWSYWLIVLILAGCGYTQPKVSEPYGLLQPVGGVRILKINGDHVVTFDGNYVLRVTPGKTKLMLAHGHNSKTPVEGSKSPYAKMIIEVKEGICYYIKAKFRFGLNKLFFGAGFKEVKSWQPVIAKQKPLRGYKKRSHSKISE